MAKTGGKAGGKRKSSTPYLKPSKRSKPSAPPPKGKNKQTASKGKAVPNDRIRGIDDATTTTSVANGKGKGKGKAEEPKKIKLRDQKTIPVPTSAFERVKKRRRDDDEDMSESGSDVSSGSEMGGSSDDEEGDEEEDEEDILDMDEDVEDGMDAAFLAGVDRDALSRSMKETERLHKLHKSQHPLEKQKREKLRLPSPSGSAGTVTDYELDSEDDLSFGDDEDMDLPSDYDLGSDDDSDDEDDEGAEVDEDDEDEQASEESDDDSDESSDDEDVQAPRKRKTKESEAAYELAPRSRLNGANGSSKGRNGKDSASDSEAEEAEVGRLPIKLPGGQVQQVEGTTKIALPPSKKKPVRQATPESEDDEEEEEEEESEDEKKMAKVATQKGRFGRMGIAEIVTQEGWKNAQKLQAAKEQIAQLGAEILAGGELIDNGPLLTRLSTFALPSIPSPEFQSPIPVPNSIRGMALLSALAVYKDLAPGYRIRQLTEKEEGEKVRDEVKRLREGEKMLVRSYKGYLKLMETEIKKRTPLASLSLKCMCELLSGLTHFNFSENIMGVLVGRIGRKSWDADSEQILQSFISVFRSDLTSLHSQTLVRLIARMTKERKYQIHPNVLSCFLHLRLKDELDQMRESKKVAKEQARREAKEQLKKFKSDTRKKWATKKQKAKEKEMKEIDKEMKEAEAEVDKEERAQVQTETLKNLFVLYFSILKTQAKTPLLPAALEGITFFAHFINIEFFRDLLACLRRIIQETEEAEPTESDDEDGGRPRAGELSPSDKIRVRLLSIATAFELLSGQGEAINIDLSDFINVLYALLRPLSLDTGIQDPPPQSRFVTAPSKSEKNAIRPLHLGRPPPKQPNLASLPTSVLLMRCLHTTFFSRHTTSPPWRSAAFIKRLTECSLLFPPQLAKNVLEFVRTIVGRDEKLEGMLDSEERMADGVYRADMDDPQLVHAFATSIYETQLLEKRYWDKNVRAEGKKLADGTKVNVSR